MPTEKLTLLVPPELEGKRLDQALARLCPRHSRSRLQDWIRNGYITVDGRKLRQRDCVTGGQSIQVDAMFEAHEQWEKEAMDLDIVHADEEIIVINKPAGLVVHPGAGNPRHTLLNALLYFSPELERVPRAGIVHRLDKDTSGLMVVARTPSSHTWLVDQLHKRLIKRHYQAIVHGVMTSGGSIDAAIGRHNIQRKRMSVKASGKAAVTHYRVLKKFRAHTHVRLQLESGRTHQIRVHMAHIHYPIVGDRVYGGRQRLPGECTDSLRETIRQFPRQALHASELVLQHPGNGESCGFSAPPPADFQSLLEAIRDDLND